MKKIIFFIFITVVVSCTSYIEYVQKKYNWKYESGFWVGDWISFNNSNYYKLQNDTLIRQDTALAIIVNIERKVGDNILIIKSISTNKLGKYCEK